MKTSSHHYCDCEHPCMSFSAIPFKIGNAIPKEIFCHVKQKREAERIRLRTDEENVSPTPDRGTRSFGRARGNLVHVLQFHCKRHSRMLSKDKQGFPQGLYTDQACWWYRSRSHGSRHLKTSVIQLAVFDRLPVRLYGAVVGGRTKMENGFCVYTFILLKSHGK